MSEEFVINVANRVKQLPPYLFGRLNALKYEKRRNNIDIIDLGMGNPNDPTPQPIIQKLCEAVQDPRNHRYTVSANGLFNLRREVARYYEKQFEVNLDPGKRGDLHHRVKGRDITPVFGVVGDGRYRNCA